MHDRGGTCKRSGGDIGLMNTPRLLSVGIKDVDFGSNVTVVDPVNLYGCAIGDDCFIGPFVEIQKDVVLGKRCRIQSHSFICELVTIGDDCFISHGVMFINDKFTEGRKEWLSRKTIVGPRVRIGSNSTILPVIIGHDAVIGAGSVVTKNVPPGAIVKGNPAQ